MKKLLVIAGFGFLGIVALLVFGVLVSLVISTFVGRNDNSKPEKSVGGLATSPISDVMPDGELAEAFSIFSSYTDIQREEIEKKIENKVINWNLLVFNVSKEDEESYVIQSTGSKSVGTFCHIRNPDIATRKRLVTLRSGDEFNCKGIIKGFFLRNVVVDPAIMN